MSLIKQSMLEFSKLIDIAQTKIFGLIDNLAVIKEIIISDID